jgi:hypothetical protein
MELVEKTSYFSDKMNPLCFADFDTGYKGDKYGIEGY